MNYPLHNSDAKLIGMWAAISTLLSASMILFYDDKLLLGHILVGSLLCSLGQIWIFNRLDMEKILASRINTLSAVFMLLWSIIVFAVMFMVAKTQLLHVYILTALSAAALITAVFSIKKTHHDKSVR